MKNDDKRRQTGCPVAFGLDTFGDRWTLLIIREMMIHGQTSYSAFEKIGEGISTNILADRLKHLETEGMIKKARDPKSGRSFIYSLTPKGIDLAPVLIEIIRWSGKHDTRPVALKGTVNKIKRNRTGFEAEIRRIKA